MTDGARILTIPRHNPVNAYTMGGIVRHVLRLTTEGSQLHSRNCQTLGAAPAKPGGLPRLR